MITNFLIFDFYSTHRSLILSLFPKNHKRYLLTLRVLMNIPQSTCQLDKAIKV